MLYFYAREMYVARKRRHAPNPTHSSLQYNFLRPITISHCGQSSNDSVVPSPILKY